MFLFISVLLWATAHGGYPPFVSNGIIFSRAPNHPQNISYFRAPILYNSKSENIYDVNGAPCVYNSECTTCTYGYSQSCIGNRCQCLPIADHGIEVQNYPTYQMLKNNVIDCVQHTNNNPLLIYFDKGYKRCMTDTLIDTSEAACFYHDRYRSIVDNRLYCLNALERIDMICTENKMCQDALNTTETIGLCMDGICHVRSINDLANYILSEFNCSDSETTYCKELSYKYTPATNERHIACSNQCLREQGKSGIASTSKNDCMCFKSSQFPPTRVKE